MSHGSITSYIDVAQVMLYLFWIFFAGLILYLRREDKREGYPMESDWTERAPRMVARGFPDLPKPKTFKLVDGSEVTVPNDKRETREINAVPVGAWPGAPLVPTGDPMVDGVGPAAYAERQDIPDLTHEGAVRIVPLRVAPDYSIDHRDQDPRGMSVIGADGAVAGSVVDVWIDRTEAFIRYLEVEAVTVAGPREVLVPIGFVQFDMAARQVKVGAILAEQFARVPQTANGEQVTRLEEDKISGYFAGGLLYATPARQEPLL